MSAVSQYTIQCQIANNLLQRNAIGKKKTTYVYFIPTEQKKKIYRKLMMRSTSQQINQND